MKLVNTVMILVLLSGCQQKKINLSGRCKKIAIRTFISEGITNWYYIRINEPGKKVIIWQVKNLSKISML